MTNRQIAILVRLFITAAMAVGWDQYATVGATEPAAPAATEEDQITISQSDDGSLTTIVVPGQNGVVAWSDVLRGVARAKGLDDSALNGVLPDRSIDLNSRASRLTLLLVSRALAPQIRLQPVAIGDEVSAWALQITLNQDALSASRRKLKQLLRRHLTKDHEGQSYRIQFDEGWEDHPVSHALVVTIHGFDSLPENVELLATPAREAGLPCAAFHYPNDQPLSLSAQLLSAELKRLKEEHPKRQVTLVTHSMGGLVARECIEDDALKPGNVRRLIMVAPPNGGSQLAYFSVGTDFHEHFVRRRGEGGLFERFRDSYDDGVDEASQDLQPDSAYLRKLAGLERNPKVRYSVILGTRAPSTRERLDQLRASIREAGERSRIARLFGTKLDKMLADMDEVVDGNGDGVVAIKRGRLAGVDDTVLLRFRHLLPASDPEGIKQVQAAIRKRL